MTKTQALKKLSAAHHRITRTREAILGVLLEPHGRPLSAAEIFKALDGGVDLVTIYRNLSVFEEAGLVCRADFSDETARFTLGHAEHHHHHVVCRSCGRAAPIDACGLGPVERRLRALGFEDLEHKLEFRGRCPKCASAKS